MRPREDQEQPRYPSLGAPRANSRQSGELQGAFGWKEPSECSEGCILGQRRAGRGTGLILMSQAGCDVPLSTAKQAT